MRVSINHKSGLRKIHCANHWFSRLFFRKPCAFECKTKNKYILYIFNATLPKPVLNNIASNLIIFLVFFAFECTGQDIYKTPSGQKYHLSNCRMVKNVSKKLINEEDITKYQLNACKICNPPSKNAIVSSKLANNKAVGESNSVQCNGATQSGKRCKHKTRLSNGYCYQHTSQHANKNISNNFNVNSRNLSTCGAKTKSGGFCKRKVLNGGHCFQHK